MATLEDILLAVSGLGARLDKMDARLDKIETRLDTMEAWQSSQPDMRLMLANSKVMIERMIYFEGEMRMMRSAINDHARENVTPGEVASLHHDLSAYRQQQLFDGGRLLRLETVLELPPQ